MEEKEIIRKFLTEINGAILRIDGGCSSCIGDFCFDIKDDLAKYGLKLVPTDTYPIAVLIEDI